MPRRVNSLTNLSSVPLDTKTNTASINTARNTILNTQFKQQTAKIEKFKAKYLENVSNSKSKFNSEKIIDKSTSEIKQKYNKRSISPNKKKKEFSLNIVTTDFQQNNNDKLKSNCDVDNSYSIFRPMTARSGESDDDNTLNQIKRNINQNDDLFFKSDSVNGDSDDLNWIENLQAMDVEQFSNKDNTNYNYLSNYKDNIDSSTDQISSQLNVDNISYKDDIVKMSTYFTSIDKHQTEDNDFIPEEIYEYTSSPEIIDKHIKNKDILTNELFNSTNNLIKNEQEKLDSDMTLNLKYFNNNSDNLSFQSSDKLTNFVQKNIESSEISNFTHKSNHLDIKRPNTTRNEKLIKNSQNLRKSLNANNGLSLTSSKINEGININDDFVTNRSSIDQKKYINSNQKSNQSIQNNMNSNLPVDNHKNQKKDFSNNFPINVSKNFSKSPKTNNQEKTSECLYSSNFDASLEKLTKIEKSLLSINNILSKEKKPELVESPYSKNFKQFNSILDKAVRLKTDMFDGYTNVKKLKKCKYTQEMAASIIQLSLKRCLLNKNINKISIESERKNIVKPLSNNLITNKDFKDDKVIKANVKSDKKQTIQNRKEEQRKREKQVAEEEIASLMAAGKLNKPQSRSKTPNNKITVASQLLADLNQIDSNEKSMLGFELENKTTVEDVFDVLKHLEGGRSEFINNETINLLNEWNNDNHIKIPDTNSEYLVKELSKGNQEKILNMDDLLMQNIPTDKISEFIDFMEKGGDMTIEDLYSSQKLSIENRKNVNNNVSTEPIEGILSSEDRCMSVQQLKKALEYQRHLDDQQAKVVETEYESSITRHLAFIDQLIEDKRQLTEKLEILQKKFTSVTNHLQNELSTREQSHQIEIKKIKDMHSANEHLKRERWMKNEAKKIKESTMKGFEPELARLMSQHKTEIAKVNHLHEEEKMAWEESAAKRYAKMLEDLRMKMAEETDAACARERMLAKQSYDKQLNQDRILIEEQRRRLYEEVREEKDRLTQESCRYRLESDELHLKLKEAHRTTGDILKKEYETAKTELEIRHQAEIRTLRDEISNERGKLEKEFTERQEQFLLSKEREMREKLRKENEKEIDDSVRAAFETKEGEINFLKRDYELQIKKLKDKYENEILGLETSERQVSEKYNQIKASLLDVEGENEKLKIVVKQKESHISEIQTLLDVRNEERDRLTDILRQEISDKLVSLEVGNERLKKEACDANAKHRLELERNKNQHELLLKAKQDELEEVHRRVKEAISKRSKIEEDLKVQRDAAIKRADYVQEQLLQLKNAPTLQKAPIKKNQETKLKESQTFSSRPR